MPPPFVFTLTRDQLEAKRAEAAQHGVVLEGDIGTTPEIQGVILNYAYNADTQTLTLTPVKFPGWPMTGFVSNAIKELFSQL
jgi:hypothetical protein